MHGGRAVAAEPATDGCPLRFDQFTTGLPKACMFAGRYNETCGQEAVAIFAGDGVALVIALATTPAQTKLFLPAQVLSATEGRLVRWHQDLNFKTAGSAGRVKLDDDGQSLRVSMPEAFRNASASSGSDCPFVEFVGRFVGMASSNGHLE
jgi:hypothetical protein